MKFVSLLVTAMFLAALGGQAQTGNNSSDAEIQGQQLVQKILEQSPTQNSTQSGVLQIRSAASGRTEIPITCEVAVTGTNWQTIYYLHKINTNENQAAWMSLAVTHAGALPNQYQLFKYFLETDKLGPVATNLSGNQTMIPFAGSDFWIADLGLEFFHWPDQKIIKHESRRTRACAVLESTNPHPASGAYSRVDSWIDNETLEIVHAEAYDANGKLLKVFDPKSLKKVNGQWQLQEMEIQNVQTHSRTWIKFDLKG